MCERRNRARSVLDWTVIDGNDGNRPRLAPRSLPSAATWRRYAWAYRAPTRIRAARRLTGTVVCAHTCRHTNQVPTPAVDGVQRVRPSWGAAIKTGQRVLRLTHMPMTASLGDAS